MRSLITAIFDNIFVLNDKTQNPEKNHYYCYSLNKLKCWRFMNSLIRQPFWWFKFHEQFKWENTEFGKEK